MSEKMIDKAIKIVYESHCPEDYGLEEKPPKWCEVKIETCRKCWNRKVEETNE